MTVITTLLTKDYIAVGSDGLITRWKDNKLEVMEKRQPKFVAFPRLKCVACYWGLAKIYEIKGKEVWSMHEWLKKQTELSSAQTIEQFGEELTKSLNNILKTGIAQNITNKGLGIHLAGFEIYEFGLIPELFLISNYTLVNGSYKSDKDLEFSRRTYFDYKAKTKIPDIPNQRKYIKALINKVGILAYNNGDPILFNTFANAFYQLLAHGKTKGKLKIMTLNKHDLKITELKSLSSFPIRLVKEFQTKFYKEDSKVVGGRISSKTIDTKGRWK